MKMRFLAVAFLVLVVPDLVEANVCVYKPPVIRQAHGVVLDTSNELIPGAVVTLLRDNGVIGTSTAGDDGKFNVGPLRDGKYKVHVEARGFVDARYEVIVRRHTDHWKRVIEIKLAVGMDQCGGTIEVH